jgi:hypothetical protein
MIPAGAVVCHIGIGSIPQKDNGNAFGKGDDGEEEIHREQGSDEKREEAVRMLIAIHDPHEEQRNRYLPEACAHSGKWHHQPDHVHGIIGDVGWIQVHCMAACPVVYFQGRDNRGNKCKELSRDLVEG